MKLTTQHMQKFAETLPPPRVIYDREGNSPYLSRYYLLGGPRRAAFDKFGAPKPSVVWSKLPVNVYLNQFHRGDSDRALHSHPWRWGVSLILVGGYSEERRVWLPSKGSSVVRRDYKPGQINFIRNTDFHRVDLLDGEAWTLFIAGPRVSDWGFWDRDTGQYTQWREFINRLRDPAAFEREESNV